MIDGIKPYPAYKESGVSWLGTVPEHWNVARIKNLFQETDERSENGRGLLLSLTRSRGLLPQSEASNRLASSEDLSKYRLCRPGNLVMNRMQAWSGMFAAAKIEGLVSPDYVVFRSLCNLNTKYFEHLFKTPLLIEQFASRSKGIGSGFNRLYTPEFGAVPIAFPDYEEQSVIAHFLDYVGRRIQRYIHVERKMINLLEEQKQVIIDSAVTRGLDHNVRFKPSGIEWLGDIPEHWSIKRLRFLVKNKLTYGANEAAGYANSEWPRYLRITDFRLDGSLREDTFCSLPPQIAEDYLVQPGDVLFARSGATVGKTFLVGSDIGEACHAGYLIRARHNRAQIEPAFLFAFTQSSAFSSWKDTNFSIATIQNISANKYADLHAPVHPINEQRAIIAQLNTSLGPHQTLVGKILEEIELIKGYSARLIADVVTGKLDVRAATAALPDEPDEPETVDIFNRLGGDEEDVDLEAMPEEIEA